MKQFDRIFIIVITVIVIFFAGLNIILVNNNKDLYNGRPYRVEIKRAAAIIKEKGIGSVDLESCKYITNIENIIKAAIFIIHQVIIIFAALMVLYTVLTMYQQ